MDTDFKIRIGQFEGPLELLLELIEKRKLHINDVSLSQVADEFIRHTEEYEEFPLADSADFILIASTLLLIKSKSLLPSLELTEDEEQNIKDLEKRLALYKAYKEASILIRGIYGTNPLHFALERRYQSIVFAPSGDVNADALLAAIKGVIDRAPHKGEAVPKVMVKKVVSLEEMIDSLKGRVEKSIKTSFRDFSKIGKADKVDVIVSFLAMLELVRHGVVRVTQDSHFDDIVIESEALGVPRL